VFKVNKLIAKEFWKEMLPALTKGHKNSIFVNGQFQTFEQDPVYVNNRTLVHILSLSVNLGATVEWNKEFNTILITSVPDVVQIKIGSNEATRNGTPIELDSSAQVINNRMMVPIRFVSESLGAKVKWDAPTNNIFLAN
jgi:Copper amine oxidase N-terminal domain